MYSGRWPLWTRPIGVHVYHGIFVEHPVGSVLFLTYRHVMKCLQVFCSMMFDCAKKPVVAAIVLERKGVASNTLVQPGENTPPRASVRLPVGSTCQKEVQRWKLEVVKPRFV